MNDKRIILTLFVASFMAGMAAGWYLYGPKHGKVEQYAAEQRQHDGSLVLEKKPGVAAEAAAAAPAPAVPKGGKVERTTVIKVKPKPAPKVGPVKPGPYGLCPVPRECPALTVRLDLIKMKDDGRRVVASSPDGDIVAGIDVPVLPPVVRDVPLWAAGATVTQDRRYGAFLDRDLGPFRVGAEVAQAEGGGPEFRLRAGIRF